MKDADKIRMQLAVIADRWQSGKLVPLSLDEISDLVQTVIQLRIWLNAALDELDARTGR